MSFENPVSHRPNLVSVCNSGPSERGIETSFESDDIEPRGQENESQYRNVAWANTLTRKRKNYHPQKCDGKIVEISGPSKMTGRQDPLWDQRRVVISAFQMWVVWLRKDAEIPHKVIDQKAIGGQYSLQLCSWIVCRLVHISRELLSPKELRIHA